VSPYAYVAASTRRFTRVAFARFIAISSISNDGCSRRAKLRVSFPCEGLLAVLKNTRLVIVSSCRATIARNDDDSLAAEEEILDGDFSSPRERNLYDRQGNYFSAT
jgi:hypothetical protein